DHLGLGMGIVDFRRESVPSVEEIETLAAAGAAVVAQERMAMNPDCGFAPDAGEPPTIEEAYEKLSRLVSADRQLRERFAVAGQAGHEPSRPRRGYPVSFVPDRRVPGELPLDPPLAAGCPTLTGPPPRDAAAERELLGGPPMNEYARPATPIARVVLASF